MKIGIVTVQVPFITGGAEIHANSLKDQLIARKYEADIITIPFKWYPPEKILDIMYMARLIDIEEVNGIKIDRIISMKFPAYYIQHSNKVAWILHQHRQAYELYGTPYSDLHQSEIGRKVTLEIQRWDNNLLRREFHHIFTNSHNVALRLKKYNQIDAEPLYHPPLNYSRLRCDEFGDFILYPGRFDSIKRQHLIVEAIAKTTYPLNLVLIGPHDGHYGKSVIEMINKLNLNSRIYVLGIVSEDKKIELYAKCLAVYNGVYEEDYGYLTLEGFFSRKPVITHYDSGGPLEFVTDNYNGFITNPTSEEIALKLDLLYENRKLARQMGLAGYNTIIEKNISWDYAIERLLS